MWVGPGLEAYTGFENGLETILRNTGPAVADAKVRSRPVAQLQREAAGASLWIVHQIAYQASHAARLGDNDRRSPLPLGIGHVWTREQLGITAQSRQRSSQIVRYH